VWPTDIWPTDIWPTDIWPTDIWQKHLILVGVKVEWLTSLFFSLQAKRLSTKRHRAKAKSNFTNSILDVIFEI
jgi:hypothetical protein